MRDETDIETYVEEDPFRPGAADARLIEEGVPVWALIGHLPAVDGSRHKVAEDYGITDEAMTAVMAYYEQHRAEIDGRIAANDIDRHGGPMPRGYDVEAEVRFRGQLRPGTAFALRYGQFTIAHGHITRLLALDEPDAAR